MSDQTVDLPPLSEVARLDAEISTVMHRPGSGAGAGAGDDRGKVTTPIRERANATLPAALIERRIRRGLRP